MEPLNTNQKYRELLIKNAFEIMKSDRLEYSKQSIFYLPNKKIDSKKKTNTKK